MRTLEEALSEERAKADKARKSEAMFLRDGLIWNAKGEHILAEKHEQLECWLEELKEYRKYIELTEIPEQYKLGFQDGIVNGFENGYNKAIDDFAEKLKENISESFIWGMIADCFKYKNMNDTSDKIVDYVIDTANELAEQLKDGGENERNIIQSKAD